MIADTMRALLGQSYPHFEIVVVDDRSSDATASIVRAAAENDARVRLVEGTDPPAGWLGKPWALQQGALASTGEVILFVDADVIYDDADALRLAVDALFAENASLLTLFPHLILRGFWENVTMPQLATIAYIYLPIWLANRTTSKVLGVGGGPGNLIWRRDWNAIGGHERLKDAVIDDVALARALRTYGKRTIIVRADEHIELRMYRGLREIVDGFTKNTFQVVGGLAGTLFTLPLIALFHFVPYVFLIEVLFDVAMGRGVPVPALIGAASVVPIVVTRVLVFLSVRYNLASAIFGHPLMMLVWTYVIVRSAWVVGVKRQLVWRGRSYEPRNTRFGG